MTRTAVALAVLLLSAAAGAEETASATPPVPAQAEQAADSAEPDEATAAAPEKEFVPPPGFKRKKFGDKILYCMKDSDIGTRFKTEKCLDEAQVRDYILAQEQNNRDFDRTRSICSNPGICAPQ